MAAQQVTLPGGLQPSIEQERLITFEPNGHLLIKGRVGSGKTLVLAARARHLHHKLSSGTMLFLTYNHALKAYVQQLLLAEENHARVIVETYHEWARRFAVGLDYPIKRWNDDGGAEQLLEATITEERRLQAHPLLALSVKEFWYPEIRWMFQLSGDSFDDYVAWQRPNTLARIVTARDRPIIWRIFNNYLSKMDETRVWDYSAPSHMIFTAVKRRGGSFRSDQQYDHVFVDEVQDFNESWLRPLVRIARITLTLAGDLAQRIYHRNFSWKSAGVQVSGNRSGRLSVPFRNTRQILDVAQYLADNGTDQDSQEGSGTAPYTEGPLVIRVQRGYWREAADAAYQVILQLCKSGRVLVAAPMQRECERAAQEIGQQANCRVPFLKDTALARSTAPIVVTTYHQLKGLEFDNVVLLGLEDRTMPQFLLSKQPEAEREEARNQLRRLVYMAMTRARRTLVLVGGTPFCRFFDRVPSNLFEYR